MLYVCPWTELPASLQADSRSQRDLNRNTGLSISSPRIRRFSGCPHEGGCSTSSATWGIKMKTTTRDRYTLIRLAQIVKSQPIEIGTISGSAYHFLYKLSTMPDNSRCSVPICKRMSEWTNAREWDMREPSCYLLHTVSPLTPGKIDRWVLSKVVFFSEDDSQDPPPTFFFSTNAFAPTKSSEINPHEPNFPILHMAGG